MDWESLEKVNGFNKRIAHLLAEASSDAYCLAKDKGALEDKWGCNVDQYLDTETEFTVFDGEALIISFRGTEPDQLSDWLTDLYAVKLPLTEQFEDARVNMATISEDAWRPACKSLVHGGFLHAYRRVSPIVESLARTAKRDVFLTGHSLGGAVANIAALDLDMRGVDFRRTYTYGAPRVFGWRAAQEAKNRLDGRQFRVVNRNDIVPQVPISLRFRHTGTLAYINRFNDIQLPVAGYVTYDRILGYRANAIRSHLCKHYIEGTRP